MTEKLNFRSVLIRGSRVIVLLVMFVVFSVATENFWGITNWTNLGNIMLQQAPFTVLLALAMVVTMIVGGIDLSVGANISLSAFLCAMVTKTVGSAGLGIAAGLATGICVGIINGILIAKVGFPPFVATYSMDWIVKGAVLVISKGGQLSDFNSLRAIFNTWKGTYLLVAVIIVALAWFIYNYTTFGRKTYSVGCNPAAAKLSGMKSDLLIIIAFSVSGLLAALTGIMYIAKLGAADPVLGSGFRMEAMSAALIGGASFTGAKSKISNALVGGLIIVILNNGLIHIGVPGFWQDFAQGLIIIAAILLERILEKLQEKSKG